MGSEQHGATRESNHVRKQPTTLISIYADGCVSQTINRPQSGGGTFLDHRVALFWGAVQRGCLALSDWRPLKNCRDFR